MRLDGLGDRVDEQIRNETREQTAGPEDDQVGVGDRLQDAVVRRDG